MTSVVDMFSVMFTLMTCSVWTARQPTLLSPFPHFIPCLFIGGHSYDVIMFDVDSKDRSLGMSCPPTAFVETSLLEKVCKLLTPRGRLTSSRMPFCLISSFLYYNYILYTGPAVVYTHHCDYVKHLSLLRVSLLSSLLC